MRVYLDNAATTPLDKEVFDTMAPFMLEHFGNPSSIHTHGRQVRAAIENARKTIAGLINASPSEITFTSGGTEADNQAIYCTARELKLKHAITSPIEHHAVLHTMDALQKQEGVEVSFVQLDEKGRVNLEHLEALLAAKPRSMVSLMHANNEIGNLTDIAEVGRLCRQYDAIFHSDTVQTMGHYVHDVQALGIDFLVGSAHKFHGPKGVGFLYSNAGRQVKPLIHGGSQERNLRGGTENVYGIVGLAKALEIAYRDMADHQRHISALKARLIARLKEQIDDVQFNGDSDNLEGSLYTVLNVSLPKSELNEMLLFNLDIHKISASGGSACTSGANAGSHVLRGIGADPERAAIRLSMSKYNTEAEIDYVVEKLAALYAKVPA